MFPGEVSRWKTVLSTSWSWLPLAPSTASYPMSPPVKAVRDCSDTVKTLITRPLARPAETTVMMVDSRCWRSERATMKRSDLTSPGAPRSWPG